MVTIDGFWFSGDHSGKCDAELHLDSQGAFIVVDKENQEMIFSGSESDVTISSRLGNGPRYLEFLEGQTFETQDNDQVDTWLEHFRPSVFSNFVHKLESNYQFVAITLVVVIAVVWGTVQYGVPAASLTIAHTLPEATLDRAAEETLMFLDQRMLEPTRLSDEVQQRIRNSFDPVLKNHENLRLKVDFRYSDVGPNAFALPNGQIIFTDAIVKLAKNDTELVSVLAHEIGHVKHRHSLRSMIQNSIFLLVLTMITGDVSGVSEMVLTLPVVFAELSYSRGYEIESDDYARYYMNEQQIPLHHFADLMLRMEAYGREFSRLVDVCEKSDEACDADYESEKSATEAAVDTGKIAAEQIEDDDAEEDKVKGEADDKHEGPSCWEIAEDRAIAAAKQSNRHPDSHGDRHPDAEPGSEDDGLEWMRYLSTHPMTEERIKAFQR